MKCFKDIRFVFSNATRTYGGTTGRVHAFWISELNVGSRSSRFS